MVVRRKKKSRYMRGYRNQGYGSIGQHRKSGCKGGRGAAGMHKHMWSWVIKYYPDWFGKHGFTRPQTVTTEYKGINVGELDELLTDLIRRGEVKVGPDGLYELDLSVLGYNKLLGRGKVTHKVRVRVYEATERAISKVREAGGEVIVLKEGRE